MPMREMEKEQTESSVALYKAQREEEHTCHKELNLYSGR